MTTLEFVLLLLLIDGAKMYIIYTLKVPHHLNTEMMGYMRLVTANENTFPRNAIRFPLIYYQTVGFDFPFVYMGGHMRFSTFLYPKGMPMRCAVASSLQYNGTG